MKYPENYNNDLTLKDLPNEDRPRERLLRVGVENLTGSEIIMLILGMGVKGEPVNATANRLLKEFGSLKGVLNASFEDLTSFKGIGTAKASQLIACLELARRVKYEEGDELKKKLDYSKNPITSPDDLKEVHQLLKNCIKGSEDREHFFVISLTTRNTLLGIDEITKGTLTASLVHPRETFKAAIKRHAANIMLAHNHPSENTEPSQEDLKITQRLSEAGKLMGISVLDHLIFTSSSYLSFKREGLM